MRCCQGLSVAATLAGLVVVAAPARAADPCLGALSPARIVDCLKPDGLSSTTRGIRAPSGAPPASPTAAAAPRATTPPPEVRPSVNLLVPFDFGSARLTVAGRRALDALGVALNRPELAATRFEIGGHTDAVGGDAYNLTLSRERAEAARDYLVGHGVAAERLSTAGFGRTRLYDPAHPDAAINRRVQVTRLGS